MRENVGKGETQRKLKENGEKGWKGKSMKRRGKERKNEKEKEG